MKDGKQMESHLAYRSDVDGLRAIAILSVVIYHVFPGVLNGGFIGVDIFFVISGFLISSIIFQGVEKGTFSYLEFYARRIKRIFPALIVVLLSTVTAGYFIFLPDEFKRLGLNVVAGAAFVSNILSWKEVGYFDTEADLKPLLHLWSLGVEEQYYILWPIFVAFIWRRSHNFLLLVVPVFILSFTINVYYVNIRPEATFYLPVTRFWELMMGGGVAYIDLHRRNIFNGSLAVNIVSLVGLCLLICGFIFIDNEKKFPGIWAILPTAGTFFILLSRDSFVNSEVLSNRIFVSIGLISYPLYLWHWPLLSYFKTVDFGGPISKTIILFLSAILAYVTYVGLEKPVRFGLRNVSSILILVMAIVTALGALAFTGFVSPYHSDDEISRISRAAGEWAYPGKMESFKFGSRGFYRINHDILDRTSSDSVVYFGDSNMEQYYPTIEQLGHKSNKSVIFATQGGCLPIPGVREDKHRYCDTFVNDVVAYASNPSVKTIVIAALWYQYFDSRSKYYIRDESSGNLYLGEPEGARIAIEAFGKLLRTLHGMDKKIYLVLNIPFGEALDPKNMISRSLTGGAPFFSVKYDAVSVGALKNYRDIDAALIKIAQESKAVVIDPKLFLCVDGSCPSITQAGEPIYKDAGHLRPSFARTEIRYLDETIK